MFVEGVKVKEFQENFLRDELTNWRLKQSRAESIPAFCIFPNKTLERLVEVRPVDVNSLRSISGIGRAKVEKYGGSIIHIISMNNHPSLPSRAINSPSRIVSRLERRKRRLNKVSNEASDEMKRRMHSGEFGSPPDLSLVNDAWAEILETEMSKQGRNGTFTTITGMWKTRGGKVAFKGRTQEDIMIPAGTKILAFNGDPEEGSRQPDLRLVTVTYED